MAVEKDLNSMDVIPDGVWDLEDIDILEGIKSLEHKLDNIEKLLTDSLLVNRLGSPKNKAGHKNLRMYYENRLIDDDYLLHLHDFMQLSVGQILKDFFYVDGDGAVVSDKQRCRSFIYNRLRKAGGKKQ